VPGLLEPLDDLADLCSGHLGCISAGTQTHRV
jgi:hypothetical protein